MWIVVHIASALLMAGCGSTQPSADTSDTTVPPQSRMETGHSSPDAMRGRWNAMPNPDLALDFFVAGSIAEENGEFERARNAYERAIVHDDDPSIFAALARSYVHTGNAMDALVFAEEAVQRAPDKIEYRRQLAQLYMLQGEQDSAAVQLQAVIDLDPSDVQARYSIAQMYDESDPERALELYKELRERIGEDWNLSTRLAELYSQLGRLPEAAKELEALLRLDPENVVVMQTLGSLSIRLRDYDRALSLYNKLAALDSANVSYRLGIAEIYLHRNNWDAASQSMLLALELPSIDQADAMRIGEIYFQQAVANSSRSMEAIDAALLLRKNYPEAWKPAWYLGALMFNNGNYKAAITHLETARNLDPENVQILNVLARAYMTTAQFEQAAETNNRIVALGKANSETFMQIGYAYSRLSRDEKAIDALKKSIELDPGSIDALAMLASMYAERDQFDKARDIYEHAIAAVEPGTDKQESGYYTMLNNYAYSLSERGRDLRRALELAREALNGEPGNSSFLDTVGWVYFKAGNYEQAKDHIEKAIAVRNAQGLEPGAMLYHHLGDVYLKLGDDSKAQHFWEKALEQDPGNIDLKRKLQRDPQ